jgi:peptidoglycan/xylan/chitin deacetylase (PgdA/CDA1 family)
VLIERDLPATVFVTTGHMHDESSMWNDVIIEAMRRLPAAPLDLRGVGLPVYPMQSDEDRSRTSIQVVERCKYMPPEGRLRLTTCLQSMVGSSLRQDLMLNADMLRTFTRHRIEIGGHTVNHPILTQLDDEAAFHEIVDNKRQLETITGGPLHLFAYPNGKRTVDYNERHIRIVADAGYSAAFTTETGAATSRHPRYEMPRSRPWDETPLMFSGRLLRWLQGYNS